MYFILPSFDCRTVKPIEVTVRPKGQGLGADKRPVMPKKQVKLKPGDKKVEEEPVGIAKGVGVLVTSGPHKNLYGKVRTGTSTKVRVGKVKIGVCIEFLKATWKQEGGKIMLVVI